MFILAHSWSDSFNDEKNTKQNRLRLPLLIFKNEILVLLFGMLCFYRHLPIMFCSWQQFCFAVGSSFFYSWQQFCFAVGSSFVLQLAAVLFCRQQFCFAVGSSFVLQAAVLQLRTVAVWSKQPVSNKIIWLIRFFISIFWIKIGIVQQSQ